MTGREVRPVREKPIIFGGPLVRAILAGRKTQTRHILKPQPTTYRSVSWYRPFPSRPCHYQGIGTDDLIHAYCDAPYAAGDHLWVKEPLKRNPNLWTYEADGAEVPWPARQCLAGRKRETCTPRFMNREASRLTLLVTDVRVERLQAVSEEDAVAEGLWYCEEGDAAGFWFDGPETQSAWGDGSRDCYARLWDSLHGAGAWDANPWVAAITFERAPATPQGETR